MPNAQVLDSEEVVFHANNEFISEGRNLDRAANYVLAFSPFRHVELAGRVLANYDNDGQRVRNDLSGNMKVRVIDTKKLDVAVGIQDFAGDAQQVEGRYGVASLALGLSEVTLGYGVGPERLDGFFGGVSVQFNRWARLVADHDGEYLRAGLGARYRVSDGIMLSASTKLFSEDEREDISAGLTARFAFGRPSNPLRVRNRREGKLETSANLPAESLNADRAASEPDNLSASALARLAARLDEIGLSNVEVGKDNRKRVVIKFENRRYWHSTLDGYEAVENILAEQTISPTGWVLFEEFNGVPRSAALYDSKLKALRTAWGAADPDNTTWVSKSKGSGLGVELRLEPVVDSAIATDFGVAEYDIAMRSSLRTLFGHGLSAYAAMVFEGVRSDSYRDGEFFQDRQQKTGLDEAMLQWLHRPYPGLIGQVSLGVQRFNDVELSVVDYEAALNLFSGRHQLHLHLAEFEDTNVDKESPGQIAVGSYRLWLWEQDISLSFSYGEFSDDQRGGRIVLRRYVGDVIIGLFYLRDDDQRQFGGLSFSLPLTPREGQKPWRGAYIMGQSRWQYSLGTVIDGPNNSNVLRPDFLSEPIPSFNIRRDFLDSDRAVPGFLQEKLNERYLQR